MPVDVKQTLLNAFNAYNKNKPAVTLDDVDWQNNQIWLQGMCNTRVDIVAKATSKNFKGRRTLYYTRNRIDKDLKGITIPGKASDYGSLHAVIRFLRNQGGIPVFEEEYGDRIISGDSITLVPATTSMAYIPTGQAVLRFEN